MKAQNSNNIGYRNNSKLKPPGVDIQYSKEQLEEFC